METESITAFVPVKGTSSRLPGKNWLPFGGTTLLQHKLRQLKRTRGLNRILVSSESDLLLDLAREEGVDFLRRPADLADESRPVADFVRYACDAVGTGSLLWACATSPTFGQKSLEQILSLYQGVLEDGYDSVITVMKFQHFLMDESAPLNFGRGIEHQNSQDLPRWSLFTNGATVAPVKSMTSWAERFGPNPYRFEVPLFESIDIDTQEDYELSLAIRAWENGRQPS